MYLSRIKLDTTKSATKTALQSPSKIHGTVERSFGEGREHALWRVDTLGTNKYILVMSHRRPLNDSPMVELGNGDGWESKDYDSRLNSLKAGDVYHFRLIANPTFFVRNEDNTKKKTLAVLKVEDQKKWLMYKAKRCGFVLDEDAFDVVNKEWLRFSKRETGNKFTTVTLLSVTYDGFLTVTDPDKFRNTLLTGIGRGKAFGQGMLTIVKPR